MSTICSNLLISYVLLHLMSEKIIKKDGQTGNNCLHLPNCQKNFFSSDKDKIPNLITAKQATDFHVQVVLKRILQTSVNE